MSSSKPSFGKFIEHVRDWDIDTVSRMLIADSTLALNADKSKRTALHHCAGMGYEKLNKAPEIAIEVARLLLEAGADIDAVKPMSEGGDIFEARPLWYSVARGENFALTEFLLKSGANPSGCLWASCYRNDIQTTQLLIEHGAEVDPICGETPFLFAVRYRKFKCLDLLIAAGADVNFRDVKGTSALFYAVKMKFDVPIIAQLLEWGSDPLLENINGENALNTAARMRDKTYFNLLQEKGSAQVSA